jgi:hypothetical protein
MSWRTQEQIYIIMWKSGKSGATLSEIRKTDEGLNRLLRTLKYMGISDNDINVTTQQKKWMPETKQGDGKKVKAHERKVEVDNVRPLKLVR